jgi:hypothetical protein
MDRKLVRSHLPFLAVALMFFVLALARPAQRGVWIAIAGVALIIGLRRRRRAPQNEDAPDA